MMMYDVSLPKKWSADLAYLCGLITGDGSMPKTASRRPNGKLQQRYMIYFLCEFEGFCRFYGSIFQRLFHVEPNVVPRDRKSRKILYVSRIESIQIYKFLEGLGMTVGRKARIASVPEMPDKYHVHFLAGLLDTDGGKKGSGFGLCTASAELGRFCKDMFKRNKIPFKSCPWLYKGHTYHQIYVHRRDAAKIIACIPLKNPEKVDLIKRFSC
ncbi:MAG: hypothetical protein V1887_00655 [Candidatus Aenigmatarchaeota archaeon]